MQSTLYIPGQTGLHHLHPLTKLALTILCLVLAASLSDLISLLLTFLVVVAPLAIWGRLLKRLLKNSGAVIVPFLISLSIIQGFFTPGITPLFQIGNFVFTLEGWIAGMTVAARIFLALSGALLLMLSTRPDMLMLGLTQSGLPQSLAYIVLTSIQIFPRFQDRATIIMEAQQSRGLELRASFFKRLRLLVPLISPLVLSSIVNVEERALALEARAFSRPGTKTSLIALKDSLAQRLLRSFLVLLMLALIAFRVWQVFSS